MIVILWHDGTRERRARAIYHHGDMASARRRAVNERLRDETVTYVGNRDGALRHV